MLDKVKYLVPFDMTMGSFGNIIRLVVNSLGHHPQSFFYLKVFD